MSNQYTYDHVETMYQNSKLLALHLASLKIPFTPPRSNSKLNQDSSMNFGFGEIAMLCDKYGCDKGSLNWQAPHPYKWLPHTYAWIYEALLSPHRERIKTIFECGIGSPHDPQTSANPELRLHIPAGASMRVWRDYFPKAEIYAGDIDREVLFEEDRLHTFYIDQLNPQVIEGFFKETGQECFDVMIDDGLHTAEAAYTLFSKAREYLADGGFYFIEDMPESYLLDLKERFKPYEDEFSFNYLCMNMPVSQDNNLIVIQRKKVNETKSEA